MSWLQINSQLHVTCIWDWIRMGIYRDKIEPLFRQPRVGISYLMKRGFFNKMNDEQYLKMIWLVRMGYPLDLDNPKTFNEKLQWLKLHDHNPLYTLMADKYEAKKIVEERAGKEFVVPNYGVWEHFDDIDFDVLPEKFILKTTHDNAGNFIVDDRDTFDRSAAKKFLEKHLQNYHFTRWREWVYKDIKPRIIAEKFLENSDHSDLKDYKFFCFNGEPQFSYVCTHVKKNEMPIMIQHDGAPAFSTDSLRPLYKFRHLMGHLETYTFYDNEYNVIPCSKADWPALAEPTEKPVNFEQMKAIARKMSAGIPHVRVDFYEVDGHLYVGEMTFYTSAGYEDFCPAEYNTKFGDMLQLPEPNA